MARQTIAVDLDDVLAASAAEWVAFSNRQWGTNLSVADYHEDWAQMWRVDRATESQRAGEIYDNRIIRDFRPHTGAEKVLRRLAKRFNLVIATSRVYRMHQDTLEWLNKHYGSIFKDVHFSGIYEPIAGGHKGEGLHTITKAELISQIGADYLIDDQLKHCLAVAEAGLSAILFGDYSWNQADELPAGVTRCVDWAAVEEHFDGR